jgi:sec-independent protein translocase protein TatA
MGALSVSHWLIVLVVILLLFGPKKISEMGKGLGQGLRNFKSGLTDEDAPAEPTTQASAPAKLAAASGANDTGVIVPTPDKLDLQPNATTSKPSGVAS